MSGMTDRDHFAAAALTGLLAQGDDGSFSEDSYARGAYRWADAMLRERERTNHDAAPAATVRTDADRGRTDKADPRPGKGTGDTPATHATRGEGSEQRECTEPVAWAVRYRHGDTGIVDLCRTLADCRAKWSNRTTDYWLYEPIYRQPPCQDFSPKNLTLTDAEREAVEWAEDCADSQREWKAATTLRGLLERLGGGR